MSFCEQYVCVDFLMCTFSANLVIGINIFDTQSIILMNMYVCEALS